MILVIANYRTGSTTACTELAELNNYINEDEIFHELFSSAQTLTAYNRLITNNNHNDAIIKLMPHQIINAERIIPNFTNTVFNKAEKIYYTIRLDVEAQCKSWYTCDATGKFHSDNDSDKVMPELIDTQLYNVICEHILSNWAEIDKYYRTWPGECIILESRNEPYMFNKNDINNASWPVNNYITQFNNFDIIKENS